ncbi:MAG: hypothetical protein GWP10_07230 [Nitrospiraceae bacterium]|nr:hypothetical protein [Nitrospiraceae bacterium]
MKTEPFVNIPIQKISTSENYIKQVLRNLQIDAGSKMFRYIGRIYDAVVAPKADGGDYTDIQSALDAGKTSIFVRSGTYEISSTITILSSGVTIVGESWTNTILKLANGANCDIIDVGDGVTAISDFSISDIQIDGNKANQTDFSHGILFYGESGYLITESVVKNCKVKNCHDYGIYLYHSNNNTITGNQINLNGHYGGIYLVYSNNNTINGNQVSNNYNGIYLTNSNNNTITGNQASSNNDGIYFSGSNNNTVTGNQTNLNNIGIHLDSVSNNNTITGNQSNSNNNYGINLFNSNNNTVTGNQTNLNSGNGMYLTFANNNTITGNQINSNSSNGMYLTNSDNNIIIGNRCTGNSQYGINVYDSYCDNNYVVKNYLTGNTTGSFNDAGTGTIKAASTTNDNVI